MTRPPVHAADPVTSNLAALQHEPKMGEHCRVVFEAVTRWPGLTVSEYVEKIGHPTVYGRTEVARRMSDLKADGHVYRAGRATHNGTSQSLWYPAVRERPNKRIQFGSTMPAATEEMAKQSKKRRAEVQAETPVRRAYLRAHPRCEVKALGGFTVPPCSMEIHVHEPWTRARGGPTDDPRNFATACDWHNTWLSQDEAGQSFGEANNLLISAAAGPAWLEAGGRMPGKTKEQALAAIGIEVEA